MGMGYARVSLVCALAALGAPACTNFGAQQVPVAQFDYNRAVATAMQEQMLLNVVRVRYFDAPVFLSVGSILTQYAWQGTIGVNGQQGFAIGGGLSAATTVGGSGLASYVERPTVTFLPVEGEDFSRRVFSPMPLDFIFALQEAGYATDLLFRSGIGRINDVQNLTPGGSPIIADTDREVQGRIEAERLQRYQHLIDVMRKLYVLDAIEMQVRGEGQGRERFLVISDPRTPETAALVRELRGILGLPATGNEFSITSRRLGRAPDEITIQTRSLSQIMAFLSLGVEIPADQRAQVAGFDPAGAAQAGGGIPFRVRATDARPDDAFVAVEYNGTWFSIANTDIESKRAFNVLIYGFRLLAPDQGPAAPALSLPTG